PGGARVRPHHEGLLHGRGAARRRRDAHQLAAAHPARPRDAGLAQPPVALPVRRGGGLRRRDRVGGDRPAARPGRDHPAGLTNASTRASHAFCASVISTNLTPAVWLPSSPAAAHCTRAPTTSGGVRSSSIPSTTRNRDRRSISPSARATSVSSAAPPTDRSRVRAVSVPALGLSTSHDRRASKRASLLFVTRSFLSPGTR